MSGINVSLRDKGGEIGRVSFPVAVADATTGLDLETLESGLRAVLDPIVLGTFAQTSISIPYFEDDAAPAANFAQREIGLRVLMSGDTTQKNYSLTIPTIDLDALTFAENSDDVVLADGGVMAALVSWIETNVEAQYGAIGTNEFVTVTRAYAVGRNS